MELTDILLLMLLSSFISVIMSVICAIVLRSLWAKELDFQREQLKSDEMARRGNIGNDVKAEKAQRRAEAAGRLAALFLEEKAKAGDVATDPIKLGMKIIPQVMAEYPDVALEVPAMAAKLAKGL